MTGAASRIQVFQKEWAFTTAASAIPVLQTGIVGPCFVVGFFGDKGVAMAHLDCTTQVDSLSSVIEKVRKVVSETDFLRAEIIGGWQEALLSKELGDGILKRLQEAGIRCIDTSKMYVKSSLSAAEFSEGISEKDRTLHYFHGVLADARCEMLCVVDSVDMCFKQEQLRRTIAFLVTAEEYLPLQEVLTSQSTS
jgi:hypothetical protein